MNLGQVVQFNNKHPMWCGVLGIITGFYVTDFEKIITVTVILPGRHGMTVRVNERDDLLEPIGTAEYIPETC